MEAGELLVRIAEIEVYPEWLDAYLDSARTVGAESVVKEPGVVCIFPMRRRDAPLPRTTPRSSPRSPPPGPTPSSARFRTSSTPY